jgi:hypothetical protein
MDCNITKTELPAAGATRHQTTIFRSWAVSDRLLGLLRHFKSDTSGAVTVDFVVLTAAIVSIGVMAGSAISTGAESSTAKTEKCLTIVGKLAFKANLSAKQKQRRIERRCGRL